MTRDQAGSWLKTNAVGLATLAIMALGAAMVLGTTQSDLDAATEAVSELRADDTTAGKERATMRSDLRVVELRQSTIVESLKEVTSSVKALDTAVTRLETIARDLRRRDRRASP